MTTRVTVTNANQGAPYADWNVEVGADSSGSQPQILKPGESTTVNLWHDGSALSVREVPKA